MLCVRMVQLMAFVVPSEGEGKNGCDLERGCVTHGYRMNTALL